MRLPYAFLATATAAWSPLRLGEAYLVIQRNQLDGMFHDVLAAVALKSLHVDATADRAEAGLDSLRGPQPGLPLLQ